ncbi:hypothetical protein IAG25_37730 [Caballeronia sp. EK]|uniref:hypothetical protein n=1 Tax=Caballeronia sp. EK TaxID=2767469 RepID=UPI001655B5F9|nr:hypothetical protein [Caballeronia sp. EK]MBC8642547.1 hypothetical protein [Caballeronia sp. EK]
MGPRAPKNAEEPKYGADATRLEATTPVMPLANPLDKSYLCGKCCPALREPLINRLGHPMYQRTVTRSIWADNMLAKQYWRYKGEVGYDMTKEPPAPIMSASDQTRPSTFPLSGMQSTNRAAHVAAETAADTASDPLTRRELEAAGGKRLRIPDVIVLKCSPELLKEMKAGAADIRHFIPAQKNIERIVEVKFEGDFLDEFQALAYKDIAGGAEFNQLQPEHADSELGCQCKEKRRPTRDVPVFAPAPVPARITARRPAPTKSEPAPGSQGMRPLNETLAATQTSQVSGWEVVLVGVIVIVAIAAAPETGGGSLLLLAAP